MKSILLTLISLLLSLCLAAQPTINNNKTVSRIITVKPKEDSKNLFMKNYEFIRSNFLGFFDVLTPEGKTVDDYIDELKHTNIFESIDYNTIISFGQLPTRETIYANVESLILNERNTTSSNFPNDPDFSNQSYLALINANDAWNISTGDSTIKVAIINTGIDCTHNDIGIGNDTYSNVNTSLGENSTPYFSYGTQIAGLICAKTNNGLGIAGLAGGNNGRGVTIIPFNAIDAMNDYQIDGSLIDDYILEAVNIGARIIQIDFNSNMTSALEASINYAYNNGVTIVCGTGMDMSVAQNATAVKSPASNNRVIGVGCCTGTSNPSRYFSCYGEGIDLVAPGVQLYTTTLNNSYSHLHIGTDLAASLVTGTISLMLSVNPNLTPNEIRTILHDTAYKIPFYSSCYNSNGWCDEVGYGLLDAYAAVLAALQINITGSDPLCGEEIYTISGIPAGASVSLGTNTGGFWIQKSGNISFDSYNSTTGELSVQQTTPGNGYIKVYYDDHLLATKEFWVGGPEITNFYYMGNTLYAEASALSFYWNINGTTFWSREGRKYYPLADGTYNVSVYAVIPNCGAGPTYTTQLHVSGGNMYSLGAISSDHQVSIEPIDYSNSPQPLEAMQTMTSKQAANDVPYELKNAMTGEVSARGEMPAEGGVLDFSRVRSGLYVLTLSPAGWEPETFKLSLK